MADYVVRFDVHLIPSLKPPHLPDVVVNEAAFRVDSFEELKKQINNYFYTFIKQQGVVIMKPSKYPLGDDLHTLDLRSFVPMSVIRLISHTTTKLVTDVPDDDDEEVIIN